MDDNKIAILVYFIVLGFFICLGYFYITTYIKKELLWTNKYTNHVYGSLRSFYKFTILLSFIAGIYLVYFFTTHFSPTSSSSLLWAGLTLFLVGSLIWAWKPFFHSKLILLIVSIGSMLLLSYICIEHTPTNNEAIIALVASIMLVIQTFIMDFIIWNGFV